MLALFSRDLRLAFRGGSGALVGVLFFLAIVAVIPFAVGPDAALLARIGPAILWIGALLSSLVNLDRLFAPDRQDGSLAILRMEKARHMLALSVLAKCAAHWFSSILPLIIATPVFGILLGLEAHAVLAVIATLLVGTPAIATIGALGAAVTVALPRGALLLPVLILPLCIPVLIFGVSASYAAVTDPAPFLPPFLLLCATTLFFAVLGPVAAALALDAAD